MSLPPGARAAFQVVFRREFGVELADDDAELLGSDLLDTVGLIFGLRAGRIHRSRPARLDGVSDKRDGGGRAQSSSV